jgi:hypothetical protein
MEKENISDKEKSELIKDLKKLKNAFDLIIPPDVKAEYYRRMPMDKLNEEEELVIEIKEFKAFPRGKKPVEFEDPREAIGMVLLDKDFNGKVLNVTNYFSAEAIKKEGYKIRIPVASAGQKIGIDYYDIFGNDFFEVKELKDFEQK